MSTTHDDPSAGRANESGPIDGPAGSTGSIAGYSDALAELAAAVASSVVGLRVRRPGPMPSSAAVDRILVSGAGSAVAIDSVGHFLTAAHVVTGAIAITAHDAAGNECAARAIGVDDATDLALLHAPGLHAGPLGPSPASSPAAGQLVIAVGGPSGRQNFVTAGVLTAAGRTVRAASGSLYEDMVQTDALLDPGGSGGALADARGRLLGIHISAGSGLRGTSFAVPVATALWVAERLAERGVIDRPDLGLTVASAPLSPDLGRHAGLEGTGAVRIESLTADGVAARAGLAAGDLVVCVDETRVEDARSFRVALTDRPDERSGGRTICLGGLRDGRLFERVITPDLHPTPVPEPGVLE